MKETTIVCVHLFNDRSGSPKVLSEVVRALHDSGHPVETLTSRHAGGFLDDLPGVKLSLFYRRSENKWMTLLLYLGSQTLLFLQCLGYWRRDVVFHINTMMPFGAAIAAKLMGKTIVYHVHESSIRPIMLKRFLRLVIRLTARHILFVSNYLAEAESFPGLPQAVIYNALDKMPPAHRTPKEPPFEVLMVCSLKRYKGVDEFLAVAHHVAARDSNIRFTLVLNATQRDIDEYFSGVELPANLTLYSRQSQLDAFYSSASLLVNLSRPEEWVETFGLTLIEGMSYSLPVIAPPVGGPAEIVRDGVHGYLIACHEVERIAETIIELAGDPRRYDRLARNAQAHALTFQPEGFRKNIVKFYEQTVL